MLSSNSDPSLLTFCHITSVHFYILSVHFVANKQTTKRNKKNPYLSVLSFSVYMYSSFSKWNSKQDGCLGHGSFHVILNCVNNHSNDGEMHILPRWLQISVSCRELAFNLNKCDVPKEIIEHAAGYVTKELQSCHHVVRSVLEFVNINLKWMTVKRMFPLQSFSLLTIENKLCQTL